MRVERDAVRERLAQLYSEHGALTPELVVDDARAESSPIHSEFEWDDSVAAHRWRLEQARTLIRSVEVVVRTETLTLRTPVYVHDPKANHGVAGYVQVADLTDAESKRQALLYECGRIQSLMDRVRGLAVSVGMVEEADSMLASLTAMRRRLTAA